MPGVPSYRGCEQCRTQKKKCSATTPPCPRCSRLGLPCESLGQKRFKFVDEQPRQTALVKRSSSSISASPIPDLSNDFTRMTSALMCLVDPKLDIRMQLPLNFGGFLVDLPRRLGSNVALDTVADAFVAAFTGFRAGQSSPEAKVIMKHNQALKALRCCLSDSTTAQEPETLAAIQMVMIYQVFLGKGPWVSHCAGVAQILRSRGCSKPRNGFESTILLAQSSSMIFEALVNDNVRLSQQEWVDLVENKLNADSLSGQMMRCAARLPSLMRRGRTALDSFDDMKITEVLSDLQALHYSYKTILSQFQAQLGINPTHLTEPELQAPQESLQWMISSRLYGTAITLGIALNCLLQGLEGPSDELAEHSRYMAQDILALARTSTQYRPLGSMYLIICLPFAWIATDDQQIRNEADWWLALYREDFAGLGVGTLNTELAWLKDRFALREVGSYEKVWENAV